MDWYRRAFGAGDEGDSHASDMHDAFMEGEKAGREYAANLIKMADRFNDKNLPMEASLLLFVGVLRAYGIIHGGVRETVKARGENSPVKKMWDILEEALTADDPDKQMGEMLKRMGKELRDGDF